MAFIPAVPIPDTGRGIEVVDLESTGVTVL